MRKCPTCGLEFVTNHSTKIFCNKGCARNRNRPKKNEVRRCLQCTKPLKTITGNKSYCNDKCKNVRRIKDPVIRQQRAEELFKLAQMNN